MNLLFPDSSENLESFFLSAASHFAFIILQIRAAVKPYLSTDSPCLGGGQMGLLVLFQRVTASQEGPVNSLMSQQQVASFLILFSVYCAALCSLFYRVGVSVDVCLFIRCWCRWCFWLVSINKITATWLDQIRNRWLWISAAAACSRLLLPTEQH